MSLKEELEAFKAEFIASLTPEIASAMDRGNAEIEALRITDRALKAGDTAPDFNLPDRQSQNIRLSRLLARGPVVISFIRGSWCPSCGLEMQALALASAEITQAGGSIIAVSPQLPGVGNSAAGAEPPFPLLFDRGALVATAYRLAFALPKVLRPLYEQFGHALPEMNGGGWMLPVPATYSSTKGAG